MKSQKYEKLLLIRKLIDSYRIEYNIQDERWLGDKFDILYDMDTPTLINLAKLRGIYNVKEMLLI